MWSCGSGCGAEAEKSLSHDGIATRKVFAHPESFEFLGLCSGGTTVLYW